MKLPPSEFYDFGDYVPVGFTGDGRFDIHHIVYFLVMSRVGMHMYLWRADPKQGPCDKFINVYLCNNPEDQESKPSKLVSSN